jgi:bacteriocin biosynthesis cyclodehydratase domain-containing protein
MVQISIDGERAFEVIKQILKHCEQGSTFEQVLSRFSECDHPGVKTLLDFLLARHILVPCEDDAMPTKEEELSTDVFYWHFDPHIKPLCRRVSEARLAVVGINRLGQEIITSLHNSGCTQIQVIDDTGLHDSGFGNHTNQFNKPINFTQWEKRNHLSSIDCIIVASDIGPCDAFNWWNSLCVERKVYFLPVTLNNLIGYVGPLVVPGETACYECLTERENSQMDNVSIRRAMQLHALEGRKVAGYHPTTCSVLANLAAFEIVRFFSKAIPGPQGGSVVELNLLTSSMSRRKVLKVPRCSCCSSMNSRPPLSPYKDDVIC